MSIVIITIAVPAIMLALSNAHRARTDPIFVSRARWLAAEKLEQIIADRHAPTRLYTYVVNANYPAEASISGFTGFSRSTSITETAADLASVGTGYKTVTVTVNFTDGRARAKSFSLSTVITNYTP
jgi:hypothetical protein